MRPLRAFFVIVAPFAAGYFASYFFRTINALLSDDLSREFSLGPAQLGLLTSVYFLTFAVVQIPAGILLDLVGPRRVQRALLLVAAAGAALFGIADHFGTLLIARALIGLGVAASLTAGLKAIALWFPRERLPLVNGCYVMVGTLGVVSATVPAEWVLQLIGWKSLFEAMAGLCVLCAVVIGMVVPEPPCGSAAPRKAPIQLSRICKDGRFWRLAPLSVMCISTAWALQGLWAAPWFTDVDRLDHKSVVGRLLVMSLSLSAGALLLGMVTDQLKRRRVSPQSVLVSVAMLFIAAQIALIFDAPLSSYVIWAVIACTGAATVISYTILAELFPSEVSGQANALLNTLHIGGAFLIQTAIGLVVGRWAGEAGHVPAIAYKTAFAWNLLFQLFAFAWLLWSVFRRASVPSFAEKYQSVCLPAAPGQRE